jgi:hypothetical protein
MYSAPPSTEKRHRLLIAQTLVPTSSGSGCGMLRDETSRAATTNACAAPSETPQPDPPTLAQARQAAALCLLLLVLAAAVGHCLSALDAL